MKKNKLVFLLVLFLILLPISVKAEEIINEEVIESDTQLADEKKLQVPVIRYASHVRGTGWQGYVNGGELSGTVNQGLRIEAIKIDLDSAGISGGIEYSSHVQGTGWQDYVSNDSMSGTVNQGLQIEAIKIRLTGEMSEKYDIYYRSHVQVLGWLDWAKNDELSGSSGYGYQAEAIEIVLVEKGGSAPGNIGNAYQRIPTLVYGNVHGRGYGWTGYQTEGNTLGTINQGLRLEAMQFSLSDSGVSGGIEYSSHVQGIGWQNTVSNGITSGTVNQGLQIEAIKLALTGEVAEQYDIYYRTHCQVYGWLDWAKNGEVAGTSGYGYQVEAIEVRLVKKGEAAPGNITTPYQKMPPTIYGNVHGRGYGWTGDKTAGTILGTVNQGLRLEAVKFSLNDTGYTGGIEYTTHVQGTGWQSYVGNGSVSGTVNQGLRIEAIKIRLTGEVAEQYDIYYRAHVQVYGWLDWATSDVIAGSTGIGYQIEALEVRLVKKGESAPGNTEKPALLGKWVTENGNTYYYDQHGTMITDFYIIDGIKYFFNSKGELKGSNVRKIIDISTYQKNIDWETLVTEDNVDGVILRIAAGAESEDTMLADHLRNVKKYGIPYGIYIYSYAENYGEGVFYGTFTRNTINKHSMNPTLGVYLDLESNAITQNLGTSDYEQITRGFMTVVPETKIYTYKYYADTALNTSFLRSNITWIAQYNDYCNYSGTYDGWQYTSTGSIKGITGSVDVSVWYSSTQNL